MAPWTGNQPDARPEPTLTEQHRREQTSVPLMGFESTIPVFERSRPTPQAARGMWSADYIINNYFQTMYYEQLNSETLYTYCWLTSSLLAYECQTQSVIPSWDTWLQTWDCRIAASAGLRVTLNYWRSTSVLCQMDCPCRRTSSDQHRDLPSTVPSPRTVSLKYTGGSLTRRELRTLVIKRHFSTQGNSRKWDNMRLLFLKTFEGCRIWKSFFVSFVCLHLRSTKYCKHTYKSFINSMCMFTSNKSRTTTRIFVKYEITECFHQHDTS
jgi:hypothetical protein